MKYCLGEFSLRPNMPQFGHLLLRAMERRASRGQASLADEFASGLVARRLTNRLMREWQRERDEIANAPDLLAVLPKNSADREWVSEVGSALRTLLGRRERPELVVCESEAGPEGYLAVGAYCEARVAAVRPNDLVNAGFVAIRSGLESGNPEIFPRVYRKVCRNGAVTLDHTEAGFVARPGEVAKAVFACVGGEFQGAVERLRTTAATPVDDPIELLRRSRAAVEWAEIEEEYETTGDRTAWGLVNAVTARARSERNFPRRLEIERGAGLIAEAAAMPMALR